MRFKKYLSLLIFGIVGFLSANRVLASEEVNVYLFWGEGCPHCLAEKEFLYDLAADDPSIVIHDYEVYNDPNASKMFSEAAEKLDISVNGVPFLVIGDQYLVGYPTRDEDAAPYKIKIRSMIQKYREEGCSDLFDQENARNSSESVESGDEGDCSKSDDSDGVILPKVGNIDMEKLSLPALTVVLGFLDGFNPCAMWVLLFLISLLIGMEDRKKMWILGVAFIVASAFVYFLFMVAWLNLFQFVGFILWVRVLISGIALVGGYASLKKFFSKDPSGCDVEDSEKKQKVFDKLGKITTNKSFFLALIGIIGLAFAVNLVELVCSAGLPAVYTQVLALNEMSGANYYFYILLYILFFMLDDLFVFFIAMTTLRLTGVTTKYVRYTRLIGGILMIAIGFLLLFKPDLLMFG
jgi:thiol-disulfide isomerase/thioredoxin